MRRASTTLAAALLLSLTPAAQAAERHRLDIPSGRLGDAIVALGQQARINIGISDPELAAEPVPAVRGTMTVEQALRRMLRGGRARHAVLDGRTYRILPRPVRRTAARRPSSTPARRFEPEPPLEEQQIVVTATRRPVQLASYAGNAHLLIGDDPELLLGLRGSDVLVSRLPVVTSTHLGPGRNKLFIGGIADSSFSGSIQATTGQYLGETRLNYNAPDPDLRLYDVDRVEVLQGPQGTLYGAGSLGGIIRIIPNAPRTDRIEGAASAGASLTAHGDPGADGAAMLNLPLIQDRLALRVLAYGSSEGGYIDDTARQLEDVNRVRIWGGRGALRLQAGADWTIDLSAAAQRIRGEDGQFADREAPPLTRESAVAQPFESDYLLGDLTLQKDWKGLSLTTSFGLVRQRVHETYDSTRFGSGPEVFIQETEVTLLSAESRLSGNGGRLLDWVVGTSLVSNESEQRRQMGPAEAPPPVPGVRNTVQEAALFGEARIPLAPRISATAGARLTHARISGASLDILTPVLGPLTGNQASRNQTAFLPSVGFAAELDPALTLFARYQESFRPGGLAVSGELIRFRDGQVLPPQNVPFAGAFIRRFVNDDVATLEAGLRYGRPGRGRFDAAATFAFTRWTDIQADTVTILGFPTIANIGDGRIYTLDVRFGWRPLHGLNLEAAALLNDSKVTNPEPNIDIAAGFPLPNVADFSGRVAADYLTAIGPDMDLRFSAAARYTGESRLGVGPILGEEQGEYLDISLGAWLGMGAHTLSLTATNLLDEVGNRFAVGSPFTLLEQRQITPMRPRTLRVGWQIRF